MTIPRDEVTVDLWDVYWYGDGYGKHGNGPFATQAQAEACLRAIGWPGRVQLGRWTMQRKSLERILSKAGGRGGTPQAAAATQAVPQ
jgi:hypothetical protein